MASNRHRGPSILPLLALLLSAAALLSAACGTLEIGFESDTHVPGASTPTRIVVNTPSIAPRTPTPVPKDYVPPTPEPALTPMPVEAYPAPAGLRVAFVKDEDVWLWTAGETDVVPLTTTGEIDGDIRISDDGTIVAFVRGEELWAINSDGTGQRRLVSTADLSAMETKTEPDDRGVRLNRFVWVPGTHVVAFNTRVRVSDRTILNHDLRLVDADTLEQTVLLAPGEGGEFTYSPDGSQVTIVTPGDVSLIDADGENRRDSVLTYAPVKMYLASDYYVQPAWAADGSSLMVAIPPADPQARPIQHTTVWRLPTDGNHAELVTTIDALPVEGAVSFSHDLNYVAYGEVRQAEGDAAERIEIWLKVLRLENGDWFAYPDVSTAYGWAPDSRRFAFVAGRRMDQLQIGQWSGPIIPGSVDAGVPVDDVRWVDTYRYLFVARRNWEMGAEEDSFDLILGDTNGASAVLASATKHPAYDFALAPPPSVDMASSPIETLCSADRSLPRQPSAAVDTSDWQVFEDQERGFRFRYPSGWRLVVFDSWVGVGPAEMGEDVQWGVRLFDTSDTTVEQVISDIGHQFGSERTETRECVRFNGLEVIKVVVTTSRIADWHAESIILADEGTIFEISNGAVRDERFELFYASFHLKR